MSNLDERIIIKIKKTNILLNSTNDCEVFKKNNEKQCNTIKNNELISNVKSKSKWFIFF